MSQPQVRGQGPGGTPRRRPGAMTMAMQAVGLPKPTGPKVLRIGLQRGRTLEERIIRQRETVTVGSSEKNHFIVQAPGLPSRFELFKLVGNDYILCFTDQMRGKVGLPGGVFTLEQLRTQGMARRAGNIWQIKLSDTSKGKITIGNVTFLFQFVTPPPPMPPPQLPAAVRGGFVKSIDWSFMAALSFSYIVFFGLIIYLENADWPIEQLDVEARAAQIAELFFEEEPPPPPPEEDAEAAEEASDEEAEAPAEEEPKPAKRPQRASSSAGSSAGPSKQSGGGLSAEERARIAAEAAAQVQTMLVGALGGEGGTVADLLTQGAPTGSSADVLAQAGGVGVATGSGGAVLRTRGGGAGSGRTRGLGGLARARGGGRQVATGQVQERRIRGRIRLTGGEDIGGSGEFDQSKVVSAIRRKMPGIKRCYEMQLRNNPTLAGKVVVEFTIQTSGAVTGVRVVENSTGDASVGDCVARIIRRLRFNPGPEGGSVTYSFPFVFAPQQ